MSRGWKNPYSPYPLTGTPHTIAEVGKRNAYIFGKGDELDGLAMRVEIHDMQAKDKQGNLIPPTIIIACPRCNRGLRIDGYQKGVEIEYLDRPKPMDVPGWGHVKQTCVVTVRDVMTCSHNDGDSYCGLRFRITDNIVHKVG